jgi:DNA-binding NarL/FixJ family response regulator
LRLTPPEYGCLVPIKVVFAEDNYLLREGLSRLIEAQPELELVGTATRFDDLLSTVDATSPDVVITDIRMPPTGKDEGIRAAERLRDTHPKTGVVVLSQYAEPSYALALLERGSGGRAYLLKERVSDVGQLVEAVRQVAQGGSVIDPAVVEVLVTARSRAARSPLRHLTPREREILAEMAQGKNNAAMAAALSLTDRAVEKHINSIFAKLGLTQEADINRRVKAVLLFLAEDRLVEE